MECRAALMILSLGFFYFSNIQFIKGRCGGFIYLFIYLFAFFLSHMSHCPSCLLHIEQIVFLNLSQACHDAGMQVSVVLRSASQEFVTAAKALMSTGRQGFSYLPEAPLKGTVLNFNGVCYDLSRVPQILMLKS